MSPADLGLLQYLSTAPTSDVALRDAPALTRKLGDISGLNDLDKDGYICWVAFRGWYLTDKGKQAVAAAKAGVR